MHAPPSLSQSPFVYNLRQRISPSFSISAMPFYVWSGLSHTVVSDSKTLRSTGLYVELCSAMEEHCKGAGSPYSLPIVTRTLEMLQNVLAASCPLESLMCSYESHQTTLNDVTSEERWEICLLLTPSYIAAQFITRGPFLLLQAGGITWVSHRKPRYCWKFHPSSYLFCKSIVVFTVLCKKTPSHFSYFLKCKKYSPIPSHEENNALWGSPNLFVSFFTPSPSALKGARVLRVHHSSSPTHPLAQCNHTEA